MSRLCRLRTKTHGKDGQWAYEEIVRLREQVAAQAAVIVALRAHLKVIAGLQLCADNLMSNSDIAAKALSIPTDSTQILNEVRRAERERVAERAEVYAYISQNFIVLAEEIRAME